jgi:acetyl-CoA decarbonylase/synthase complex subunit beta
MFRTDQPRPGVAIMHAGWEGKAPDGRRWSDLHYELGGKQAPGVSGCSAGYFSSKKFLQAEGGWKSVVWVTGKVAAIAAKRLAADATVSE